MAGTSMLLGGPQARPEGLAQGAGHDTVRAALSPFHYFDANAGLPPAHDGTYTA
jgi:hypothetical protein